jgi:SSS family solute:Na+ symporter
LGIIFAAALWLIVPFAIVIPGIMAIQLYGSQLPTADKAYPTLIRNLIPLGVRGFIFAALTGAVISSLASVLNSASTIFTMDLYKRYWRKNAPQKSLVLMGRLTTVAFVLISCLIAPRLTNPKFGGIFRYIQEFQGFISPGILAAFAFGFVSKTVPPSAGVAALVLNVPIYGLLLVFCSGTFESLTVIKIAFLNRMALTFGVIVTVMALITLFKPLREPKTMPVKQDMDMTSSPLVAWLGVGVIIGVAVFFIIFW